MKNITCPGFKTAGISSGLKKNNEIDLGIIFSENMANAAGVFTKNQVKAAPVVLDMERIKSGKCRAIIVNSGNANCCTGDQGMIDAKAMAKVAAEGLGVSEELVLVASTGVIGNRLPVEKIKYAIPDIIKALSENRFYDLARAIMTTDTVPKVVSRQGKVNGKTFTVTGVAKGAGMIRPDMATMLCFVCTDIIAEPDLLNEALTRAADRSFNRITIDGDTSTNDTVIIMANGFSGITIKNTDDTDTFQNILDDVLLSLAKEIVKDGEGVTKLVKINVKGAKSDNDAQQIADTVAGSSLVKTALFGEDANWGRIIAAAGRANVPIKPDKIHIFFDNVLIVKNSIWCGPEAEAEATAILKKPEFTIQIDLNMGKGRAFVYTCDLSIEYIKINADYRS